MQRRQTKQFPTQPKKIWRRLQVEEKKHEPVGRKPTATAESIMRNGLRFVRTFSPKSIAEGKFTIQLLPATHESPMGAGVYSANGTLLGSAKIGFLPKVLVIEFIKGNAHPRESGQFTQTLGKPWPYILIQTLEEHARRQGYTHVYFRRPETTEAYQNPITGFEESARHEAKMRETQNEMNRFWGINASRLKYKKISPEFKAKKL